MTFLVWTMLAAAQLAATAGPTIAASTPPSGAAATPVEIVLYSDFQCPFCAQFSKPFRELQTKGLDGETVSVSFKHFPLSIHPAAQLAHQAALAAKNQGKFWEMHDLLFGNQARAQRADLIAYAKKLGLDLARFQKDMDSEAVKRTIAADIAEGNRLGVNATPSYTINGKPYSGAKPLAELEQLIAGDRRRARAVAEIGEATMARGPVAAPVTLELFADLQSPVSRPALDVVTRVMQRFPSDVRLQFRNFPLSFHPQAAAAHEAAMDAARQGHFWEFATFILAHQDSLREQDLIAYAGSLGLDATEFAATLREHRYAPRVDADVIAGQSRGIRGSPVVLVNGTRIDGVPSLEKLSSLVEAALAARSATAAR